jgi:uncharacterized Fe-S cluster-containing radical SAM superfamily protein
MAPIDTASFSARLRPQAVSLDEKKVLITRLSGSDQEEDLSNPVNCGGYGRIRSFRLTRYDDWSDNPLPILPAAKALRRLPGDELRTQVFQNAACNWRCWYCFVDFNRLSALPELSQFFTAGELIDFYLAESYRPDVIDLTGGQPDLVPEWILWTIEELDRRGLADQVFLWSDDNLSNRYFWEYLTEKQRARIASYPSYARVACFKGYDAASFAFNTRATPALFDQQFEIYAGLLDQGLDMYAYVTFTAVPQQGLALAMRQFVDRFQSIHVNLPLRTVPLKIVVYTPTGRRMGPDHKRALEFQHQVHAAWLEQLDRRFSAAERAVPICDVPLQRRILK